MRLLISIFCLNGLIGTLFLIFFIHINISALGDKKIEHNELVDIFLNCHSENLDLETACLSLHFAQAPKKNLNTKKTNVDGKELLEFHFERSEVSLPSVIAKMHALRMTHKGECQIRLQKNPQMLVVALEYNPKKISVTYDFFNTLELRSGIEIHIHNQECIHNLRAVHKPILVISWNSHTSLL